MINQILLYRFRFCIILFRFPPAASMTITTVPGEVEATEFQGVKLTPIKDQNNNALKGTKL